MRFLYLYVHLGLTLAACSQQITINKVCIVEGSKSFVGKNYTCQKLVYSNENLAWTISYSYNGWQIYDSIYYEIKDTTCCVKTFRAEYDEGFKAVSNYILESVDCGQKVGFSDNLLASINDQYSLSKPYLDDLNFLLKLKPINRGTEFSFKEGVSPSLFPQYGILNSEVLNSFFVVVGADNHIRNDGFYFLNFTLEREYTYKGARLHEVIINVKNKKTNSISTFRERFEIVN